MVKETKITKKKKKTVVPHVTKSHWLKHATDRVGIWTQRKKKQKKERKNKNNNNNKENSKDNRRRRNTIKEEGLNIKLHTIAHDYTDNSGISKFPLFLHSHLFISIFFFSFTLPFLSSHLSFIFVLSFGLLFDSFHLASELLDRRWGS